MKFLTPGVPHVFSKTRIDFIPQFTFNIILRCIFFSPTLFWLDFLAYPRIFAN